MTVHLAVAGDVFDGVFLCCPFSPRDILDEIWDLIGSVSEGFPTYSFKLQTEEIIAEEQAGFRAGRSTTDQNPV